MKLGVIGTGWIVEKFIDACRQSETFEPCAVCSRDEERGRAFAEKNGLALYYTNPLDMILNHDIKVVYIASPNGAHYAQAQACTEHGKHVIIEKPAVVTSRQAESLFCSAGFRSVYVFDAVRTIYNPALAAVKAALPEIGAIRYAYFNHMKYSSRYDAYQAGEHPPVFTAEYAGGASTDLGVYSIYNALYLFGEPEKSVAAAVMLPGGPDAVTTQVLQYDSFLCTLSSGKVSDTSLASEIQGEKGTIWIDHIAELQRVVLKPRQGAEQVLFESDGSNDMIYEARAFASIIQSLDNAAYGRCQAYMRAAVKLMEEARRQCGYAFPCDR